MIYDIPSYSESLKTAKEKRNFVRNIYKHIDAYISKVRNKKTYSIYKRKVITAYISAQFGILKTEEEYKDSDYTTYLFDRIRRRLKDFK